MSLRSRWGKLVVVMALLLGTTGQAAAAFLRLHFVPAADGCRLQLAGAERIGEHLGRRGLPFARADGLPPPSCVKRFRHPFTGQTVEVPLALPEGTPQIEHVWKSIVFNYGSYAVRVRFLPDGSVDVLYSSGLLAPL
jgi:hypothetical protein